MPEYGRCPRSCPQAVTSDLALSRGCSPCSGMKETSKLRTTTVDLWGLAVKIVYSKCHRAWSRFAHSVLSDARDCYLCASLSQVNSYLRLYSPRPIRAPESQRHSCPFQGQQ